MNTRENRVIFHELEKQKKRHASVFVVCCIKQSMCNCYVPTSFYQAKKLLTFYTLNNDGFYQASQCDKPRNNEWLNFN